MQKSPFNIQKSPISSLLDPLKYGFSLFFHRWPLFFKASLIFTFFSLCIIIIISGLLALLFNDGAKIVWGKLVSFFYSLEKAPFSAWLSYFYHLKRFIWVQIGLFFWIAWLDTFYVSITSLLYDNKPISLKNFFAYSFLYLPQFIAIWLLFVLPFYLKIDISHVYFRSIFTVFYLLVSYLFIFKISLSRFFIVEKNYIIEKAIGASYELSYNHFLWLTGTWISMFILFSSIIISALYTGYHLFYFLITLQKQFLPIFSLESTVFIPLITIVYILLFFVFFESIVSAADIYTYKKLLIYKQAYKPKGLADADRQHTI